MLQFDIFMLTEPWYFQMFGLVLSKKVWFGLQYKGLIVTLFFQDQYGILKLDEVSQKDDFINK